MIQIFKNFQEKMHLMETFLYSGSTLSRKLLYRKAAKKDPIISRIRLLEVFENVILTINEIEEFHDVQSKDVKYEISQTNSFSQTKTPSKLLIEETSFPIVKLPKSSFPTCDIKTIINSSLTYIISESHDTELQLNISSLFIIY